MAWATTQHLGCAVNSCGNSHWSVVCHYKPGGNIVGRQIYMKGAPCTACPVSYKCTAMKLCSPA
ncbi:hypothetical protein OSTOST_05413 [Ostertagia ostertagi]